MAWIYDFVFFCVFLPPSLPLYPPGPDQKIDIEPRPPSSSEGSTVDIRPPGEGCESEEMEPEESMDPAACFTDGEMEGETRGRWMAGSVGVLQRGTVRMIRLTHGCILCLFLLLSKHRFEGDYPMKAAVYRISYTMCSVFNIIECFLAKKLK